jgi:putative hydrolase of the HAD superfamily
VARISALFWDIGGVLLTNAWDQEERDVAIQHFQLDKTDFEARHKELLVPFEEGKLTLKEYLGQAVFYIPRTFTLQEFNQFMFSLSKPKPEVLEIARGLSSKYPMCTINNESRELNQFRIQTFSLTQIFNTFVSSCFVGIRKPDLRIYQLALDVTQRTPEECCFIDDRAVNTEGAARAGMNPVLMQNPPQLRKDLRALGIET